MWRVRKGRQQVREAGASRFEVYRYPATSAAQSLHSASYRLNVEHWGQGQHHVQELMEGWYRGRGSLQGSGCKQ